MAIFAAIIFWVIVINLENTFYVFPDPIEIQAFNLPENLVVEEDLGTAKITLQSAPRDINKIAIKDFEVYVDLKGAGEGERQVEVSVSSKNPEVRVLKVEPSVIKLQLEAITEKTVPLNYSIKGTPAENYQVKDVEFDIAELIVKGSKEDLAKVTEVQAQIALKGDETSDLEKSTTLVAIDAEGAILDDVIPEREEINAKIIIQQGLRTKTVGIEPTITGELDSGWIKSLSISPTNIQIKGSNSALSSISSVSTIGIPIAQLKEQGTVAIGISLPQNITLAEGAARTVYVTAQFEELTVEPPTIEEKPEPIPTDDGTSN